MSDIIVKKMRADEFRKKYPPSDYNYKRIFLSQENRITYISAVISPKEADTSDIKPRLRNIIKNIPNLLHVELIKEYSNKLILVEAIVKTSSDQVVIKKYLIDLSSTPPSIYEVVE